MSKVVIIEYNAGNTLSVESALRRSGAEVVLSRNPEIIKSADKVIFPGVGHAAAAMKSLNEFSLTKLIKQLKQPVLGICLGMQLLASFCEEGHTQGFSIINADCSLFKETNLKVPHMGWNSVSFKASQPLFKNIKDNSYFYFVHSYRLPVTEETIGICNYGSDFSAAVQKNNFYGVQFHPEKSSDAGQQIFSNFLNL